MASSAHPQSDAIPRVVISAWRPRPGMGRRLRAELRDHHAMLWSEGLATDRQPILAETADGSIIEIMEWASTAAIAQAAMNERVAEFVDRMAAVARPTALGALQQGRDAMAVLQPVQFDRTPPPNPPPEQRAE